MTAARLKRLAKLESRRPAERPWRDDGPAAALLQWCIASFEAVDAGKACRLPRYGPHPQPSPAKAEAMRYLGRIAARLAKDGR
jgi:hypothetical protein